MEGAERVTDVLEVPVVARIPGEVKPLGAEHRPGCPEPASLVREGPAGAVLSRRTHDPQSRDDYGLAPVQLDRVRDPAIAEPGLDAQRHHETGIEPLGETPNGRLVEMVVVVVRDQDEVDPRQRVEGNTGWRVPLHTDQTAERAGPVGPGGIGQEADAV